MLFIFDLSFYNYWKEKIEKQKKTFSVLISLWFLKYFSEKSASLSCQDNKKRTPLMLAIQEKQSDIVKFLTNSGATCDLKDSENVTCLHLVMKFNELM